MQLSSVALKSDNMWCALQTFIHHSYSMPGSEERNGTQIKGSQMSHHDASIVASCFDWWKAYVSGPNNISELKRKKLKGLLVCRIVLGRWHQSVYC